MKKKVHLNLNSACLIDFSHFSFSAFSSTQIYIRGTYMNYHLEIEEVFNKIKSNYVICTNG